MLRYRIICWVGGRQNEGEQVDFMSCFSYFMALYSKTFSVLENTAQGKRKVGSGWLINPCIHCVSKLNTLTHNKRGWPTNTAHPDRCYHPTRGQLSIRAGQK